MFIIRMLRNSYPTPSKIENNQEKKQYRKQLFYNDNTTKFGYLGFWHASGIFFFKIKRGLYDDCEKEES